MRLFIAEKPSVGREIAKCLPGPQRRHDGYIETSGGVVTWLFGHILRQAEPEEYDARYKRWRTEDLPLIPQQWQLRVGYNCEKQFAIVKGLIDRADEIVHGGDPDREGQLLVDEVLGYVHCTKPVRRILINALDEKSIKTALAHLRANAEFYNLRQSALARARADWLIGMNLSRAYTLAARRAGHDRIVLPIGRVKTPTLALVVRREREIDNFKPVDYYNIKATFAHKNGRFTAQWKPGETQAGLDSENRLLDKAIAEAKLQEFGQEPHEGQITAYSKTKKQEPAPLPFSLSSLQVLAGKRYGYAPQLVLDTAQSLYEKKLTTYPRSDCEYLPKSQLGDAATIMQHLGQAGSSELAKWAADADLKLVSRAWNDKKITAHHAIIPTTVPVQLDKLSETERRLYELIARGYIAQFYGPHVYDQTKVEVTYHDELFTASGRTERDPGWKVMYQAKKRQTADDAGEGEEKPDEDENENTLPAMRKKDGVEWADGELKSSVTKPPTRFTPATLLAAMKQIHKYVKNPEAKKQLRDVYGIGTEATRAGIIDDLIKRKFMTAKGKKKYLSPTPQAYLLIDALPDEMTYPDSTAIWEDRLHSMAEGEGTLDEFLAGQIAFTRQLCAKAGTAKMEVKGDYVCPACHHGVLTQRKGRNGIFWGCSNYPNCRLTTADQDGKPDMAEAERRAAGRSSGSYGAAGGRRRTPARASGRGAGRPVPPSPSVSFAAFSEPVYSDADYAGASSAVSAADEAELNSLFAPDAADYEAQMAADMAAYVPTDVPVSSAAPAQRRTSWQDKPHYSASPMEQLARQARGTVARPGAPRTEADPPAEEYGCPHCHQGHLRRIHGKNGFFWGCTNYPRCTATFDDRQGRPALD